MGCGDRPEGVLIMISEIATRLLPPSTINVALDIGAPVVVPRNPQLNGVGLWSVAVTRSVYVARFNLPQSDLLIAGHGWLRWRAMASSRSQALRTLMISSSMAPPASR